MKLAIGKKLATLCCAALMLAACGAAPAKIASEAPASEVSMPSSAATPEKPDEEPEAESQAAEPAAFEPEWPWNLGLEDAPADLDNLDMVTAVYVRPLVPNNAIWSGDSWNSPEELLADRLIDVCSYNNFLDLPRDFELCYPEEYINAPADRVEESLLRHFDVSREHLRTASQYHPDTHTYTLIGGFGGGWSAAAMSAEQEGNFIRIRVGIHSMMTMENLEQDLREGITDAAQGAYWKEHAQVQEDGTLLIPAGTLTVELTEGNVVKYRSLIFDEGFSW